MHSSLFFLFSLLSLFLTLLTPALASNAIIFRNRCTHPIYVFEVGPGLPGNEDQAIAISGGGNHTYAMRNTEALGAGIALKIRDVPQYRVAPSGILQAEYHLEPSTARIWYDLSFIDCEPSAGPTDPRFCPLREGGVRMHVPGREDEGCLPAECGPKGGCKLVYLQHGSWFGEPTLSCGVGVDIHVETCKSVALLPSFLSNPENVLTYAMYSGLNSDGRRTLLPSLNAPVPDSSAAPISPPAQNPLAVSPNGLCTSIPQHPSPHQTKSPN